MSEPRFPQKPLALWCQSLGCPKNTVDTEVLLGRLGLPLVQTEEIEDAELILINTCAFIEPSVRESINTILQIAQEKQERNPKALLAVAGCLVGRYGREELAQELPEVDLWLPTAEMDSWAEAILKKLNATNSPLREGRMISTPPSYAWLKIAEGCRHRCAFCAIPSIRGPLCTRPKQAILAEAKSILAQGTKELVLIAQDLTDYGHDMPSEGTLPELLRDLSELQGLSWLRMLYLYPNGITKELLQTVAEIGRPLLPYFDIPFQHCHPDILKKMGRPFANARPEEVCERIRDILPDAAIRTTLITGYPGESEEQFQALYDFVQRTAFTNLGVFPYWAEEGTVAASLPDQLPQEVKEERANAIMELQQDISHDFLESRIGSVEELIVDTENNEWPGLHNGRVWHQAPEIDGISYISGPKVKPGAIVRGEIIESSDYDLTALSVEEEK